MVDRTYLEKLRERHSTGVASLLAAMLLTLAPTAAMAEDLPINAGDTAWMLTSTALVLMMTIPGLALFYGGLVRKGNVLTTMAQSFATTCLVSVLWVLVGYSLTFGNGNSLIESVKLIVLNYLNKQLCILWVCSITSFLEPMGPCLIIGWGQIE